MTSTLTFLMIGGNILALVGGLATFARWFRKWFKTTLLRTISEPLQQMQLTVDTVNQEIQRVHKRIDDHLEAHSHA